MAVVRCPECGYFNVEPGACRSCGRSSAPLPSLSRVLPAADRNAALDVSGRYRIRYRRGILLGMTIFPAAIGFVIHLDRNPDEPWRNLIGLLALAGIFCAHFLMRELVYSCPACHVQDQEFVEADQCPGYGALVRPVRPR